MNSEAKTCQNCKQQFTIETEDFSFYEKMNVPPPTFCWECRLQRRMAWRNERSLYKRRDGLTGKEVISIFSTDKPQAVYGHENWWSDKWDPMNWGRAYDFSKPFFSQLEILMREVPALALVNINPSNSEYCSFADGNKDCYLNFAAGFNERVCYSTRVGFCKDSLDLLGCARNELCYDNTNCSDCYRLFHSINCKGCVDSYFLYNCKNCTNCIGSTNLISRSYYIFNQPYTKEEYEKKIKELNLDSRAGLLKASEKFMQILSGAIRRYSNIINSPGSTGDNVYNSKNCRVSFDILDKAEDCAYLFHSYNLRDNHDGIGMFSDELTYESVDGNFNSRLLSSITIYHSNDVYYSLNCHGSNHLFGCTGLRNKSYCILNKQYSKEEYETLVPKIIEHMTSMPYTDKKGRVYRYGEFFPIEISPFAYNETIAQEYFPLTKGDAEMRGYSWKDSEARNYKITKNPNDLPERIQGISDEILNEVIGCAHDGKCKDQCTVAFRIVPQELQFYKQSNIPVPQLCHNCRNSDRLKRRNPLKLWHRKCRCAGNTSENGVSKNTARHFHGADHCPNEFETSYAPDRPEIVYCEKCYLSEVS